MTFRSWLKTQVGVDTIIGDLATDAFDDKGWKGRTAKSLKTRLVNHNACYGAFNAFEIAVTEYEESKSIV